jgi:hypothetical protein
VPSTQQWVYTDLVSGETIAVSNPDLPPRWGTVGDDCHGPMGLYIIAQRLITKGASGEATYADLMNAPYDPTSDLDSGYTLPAIPDPTPAEEPTNG